MQFSSLHPSASGVSEEASSENILNSETAVPEAPQSQQDGQLNMMLESFLDI